MQPDELDREIARLVRAGDMEAALRLVREDMRPEVDPDEATGCADDFLPGTADQWRDALPKTETAEPVADEHELIERLLDAQQDINYAANCRMDQSLCNASALIDEIEPILRRALAREHPQQTEVVEALEKADAAIREMFRYYDGGETRGSYDGKPERAQLRKAGYATTKALAALKGSRP